jgi:rSAM/selenodomain-associated transferase 2
MFVSIIIPTLNEEAHLPLTLRPLAQRPDVELIVVDGGSTDRTVEVAQIFTPYVFVARASRAARMNLGARHATGDILLFLHADTVLLPGALEELERRIIGEGAVGGAFDLHIDSSRPILKWIARLASRRSQLLRRPGGNQGQFVWRQVFEALEGFPEISMLEDLAFARKLRRSGRLTFISTGLITSGRRWKANGVLKTALVNGWVGFLFLLGVQPRRLRRLHDRWLVRGQTRRDQNQLLPPSEISAG